MTILAVLRSGGRYGPTDVDRLFRAARYHTKRPFRTVVLTDVEAKHFDLDVVDEVLPLAHAWPGWWAKLEAFRVEAREVLYLDLDTVIIGSLHQFIDAILPLEHNTLIMLRGFYKVDECSGVMGWKLGLQCLTEMFEAGSVHFEKSDQRTMQCQWRRAGDRTAGRFRGDQDWIRYAADELGIRKLLWQNLSSSLSHAIKSYKVDLKHGAIEPSESTSLIVFHGEPKPSSMPRKPCWLAQAQLEGERG
jgi:hypothetical protein